MPFDSRLFQLKARGDGSERPHDYLARSSSCRQHGSPRDETRPDLDLRGPHSNHITSSLDTANGFKIGHTLACPCTSSPTSNDGRADAHSQARPIPPPTPLDEEAAHQARCHRCQHRLPSEFNGVVQQGIGVSAGRRHAPIALDRSERMSGSHGDFNATLSHARQ